MLVTKDMLKELKLQVEECKVCGHLTLQYKRAIGEWLCLTCGAVTSLEWVAK